MDMNEPIPSVSFDELENGFERTLRELEDLLNVALALSQWSQQTDRGGREVFSRMRNGLRVRARHLLDLVEAEAAVLEEVSKRPDLRISPEEITEIVGQIAALQVTRKRPRGEIT